MLDAAQKFERVFKRFDEMNSYFKSELILGDGLPDNDDWENVRRLVIFLENLYDLTLKISGSLYVTANKFLRNFVIFIVFYEIGNYVVMIYWVQWLKKCRISMISIGGI